MKHRPKPINAISQSNGDWSWKPDNKDIPELKYKALKKKGKKNKRKKVCRKANNEFYSSDEWLELRVRALEKYECKCMMCGQSPKEHGIVIHVGHIKPRSKHPGLSLCFDNLQLLCEACNKGKGNKHQTDWRPDSLDQRLDEAHLASIQDIYI